jgi:two-component system invasion response regulator UvrY
MKILLVDDHAIVRRGMRELLGEEFEAAEFEEAATGEEAIEIVKRSSFDLVVLDLSMPGRGGLDALKDIRSTSPRLPVLVLSQHAEEQYAIRAFRAGSAGYVTKDSAPDELVKAARKALAGGKYVSSSLAEHLATRLASDPDQRVEDTLSDRELQVLRLLANGKTVKEIGAELALSEKTISTYRARILDKLNAKTNAELMRFALRAGLTQ